MAPPTSRNPAQAVASLFWFSPSESSHDLFSLVSRIILGSVHCCILSLFTVVYSRLVVVLARWSLLICRYTFTFTSRD